MNKKTTTYRFPYELDKQLTECAKKNDLPKNTVVKMAVKEFLRNEEKVGCEST